VYYKRERERERERKPNMNRPRETTLKESYRNELAIIL